MTAWYQRVKTSADLFTASRDALHDERTARDQAPAKPRRWKLQDMVHGAIGMSLGSGVARGVSRVLGLNPRFADKLETAAMGAGAAMNTGVVKWASDDPEINRIEQAIPKIAAHRRRAFRIGFMKAATDLGAIRMTPSPAAQACHNVAREKLAAVFINPADVLRIPQAAGKAIQSYSRQTGSLLGTAAAPSEQEKKLTELEMQRVLLEEKLERLRSNQANRALREVLARRRT